MWNAKFATVNRYPIIPYVSSTRIKKILGFGFGYNNGTSPRLRVFPQSPKIKYADLGKKFKSEVTILLRDLLKYIWAHFQDAN